jgi:hypothetical protein
MVFYSGSLWEIQKGVKSALDSYLTLFHYVRFAILNKDKMAAR